MTDGSVAPYQDVRTGLPAVLRLPAIREYLHDAARHHPERQAAVAVIERSVSEVYNLRFERLFWHELLARLAPLQAAARAPVGVTVQRRAQDQLARLAARERALEARGDIAVTAGLERALRTDQWTAPVGAAPEYLHKHTDGLIQDEHAAKEPEALRRLFVGLGGMSQASARRREATARYDRTLRQRAKRFGSRAATSVANAARRLSRHRRDGASPGAVGHGAPNRHGHGSRQPPAPGHSHGHHGHSHHGHGGGPGRQERGGYPRQWLGGVPYDVFLDRVAASAEPSRAGRATTRPGRQSGHRPGFGNGSGNGSGNGPRTACRPEGETERGRDTRAYQAEVAARVASIDRDLRARTVEHARSDERGRRALAHEAAASREQAGEVGARYRQEGVAALDAAAQGVRADFGAAFARSLDASRRHTTMATPAPAATPGAGARPTRAPGLGVRPRRRL